MNPLIESTLSLLIPSVVLLHLAWAPYTKVEESFNIQAVHDVLVHGVPTENVNEYLAKNYDHVSFPGSVPRTFVGALVLSGLSRPLVHFFHSPASVQLLVRAILGLFNAFALLSFRRVVWKVYGKAASNWYVLFQASQFHIMYYASRTLPNMFAFGMSTFALGFYLKSTTIPDRAVSDKNLRLSFYLLTIAGVIFRSELALFLATLAFYQLLQRLPTQGLTPYLKLVIPAGLAGALIALTVTVAVDTFFWRTWPYPLWPEWTAFAYNTLQGHASEWGTSPWHYYFFNALPRLLLNPLTYTLLIPFASLNAATRRPSMDLLFPSVLFVAIYSFLPHKEWRFVAYVVPALTAVASAGAGWISTRAPKARLYRIATLVLAASVVASFAASGALLAVSSLNYPGGAALTRLHAIAALRDPTAPKIKVHLDNLACQTGVTHFLEKAGPGRADRNGGGSSDRKGKWVLTDEGGIEWVAFPEGFKEAAGAHARWVYDKTDDADRLLDPAFWDRFDYALAERPEKVIGKWEVVDVIHGFGGIKVLRPGEEIGEDWVEEGLSAQSESLRELVLGEKRRQWGMLPDLWAAFEAFARGKVTRGWWVGVKMVPKIRILKRLPVL